MGTPLYWVVFNIFVLVAIVLDLKVFHRRPHRMSVREAGLFSAIWIALAVAFGLLIYFHSGEQPALEFFTGYVIEKSLSIDNLFLFLVIFSTFHVDERVQHRLLEWGIVGALLMRGAMIGAGAALIERFSWVLYLFGAFLIYAGVHMLFAKKKEMHPEQNAVLRGARMAGSPHRFCSCCWSWKSRISRWPWTRFRQSSASHAIRLSFTPRTCLRFSACARSIFCWPAYWANSGFSPRGSPAC